MQSTKIASVPASISMGATTIFVPGITPAARKRSSASWTLLEVAITTAEMAMPMKSMRRIINN